MIKILTKYFNKLFFLDVGDIIWAKRYQNEKEKEKIMEGHQEGPYVVIKKTFFNVYALFCTSKYNNNNFTHIIPTRVLYFFYCFFIPNTKTSHQTKGSQHTDLPENHSNPHPHQQYQKNL